MATRSAVIQVEPDLAEAFNAAPEQQQERVKSAMRSLLRLVPTIREKAPRLSKKESALFLKINRNLSEDKQKRYDELTEKRLDDRLTEQEYSELGALIKEIEQIWGERLQAVIDLARLRKMAPEKMMKQLELDPRVKVS
ncbi:MAG: hypothetical protein ACREAM_15305 [Blastocatellia bacterium]